MRAGPYSCRLRKRFYHWRHDMPDRAALFSQLLRSTRVYAVTDDALAVDRMLDVVDQLLDAGIRLFQFRDKHLSDGERARVAADLAERVHQRGGLVIVNDRV